MAGPAYTVTCPLMRIDIKNLSEIRDETPAFQKGGDWKIINIEPRMAWPTKAQNFEFDGEDVWIIPVTKDAFPGLAIRNSGVNSEETYALLYRALSLLAWLEDAGATVHSRGGGRPFFPHYGTDNPPRHITQSPFDLTDLPEVENPNAKLALALMREGRGLHHPGYSFLSFYRVIERAIPDGRDRGPWMAEAIDRLEDHRATEALARLRETFDGDVGMHLRNSNRNAVAHASGDVVANPDEPGDYSRLNQELPIIEWLAVAAINDFFGIQTKHAAWQQHLYELRGWKRLFGPDLLGLIRNGQEPPAGQTIDLPEIDLRLRRSEPFEGLDRMRPTGWAVYDRKIEVQYRSSDEYIHLRLLLDLEEERLRFDTANSLQLNDDGSAMAARAGKTIARFLQDYFLNGELQVWDSDDGSLISKCDAFLPVNVMFNPDRAKAELDAWDAEIVRRLMR